MLGLRYHFNSIVPVQTSLKLLSCRLVTFRIPLYHLIVNCAEKHSIFMFYDCITLHKYGIKPIMKIKDDLHIGISLLHLTLLTRKADTTTFTTFRMVDVISKCRIQEGNNLMTNGSLKCSFIRVITSVKKLRTEYSTGVSTKTFIMMNCTAS